MSNDDAVDKHSMAFMVHQVPLNDIILEKMDRNVLQFLVYDIPFWDNGYTGINDLGRYYLQNITKITEKLGIPLYEVLKYNINQGLEVEEMNNSEYETEQIYELIETQNITDATIFKHLRKSMQDVYEYFLYNKIATIPVCEIMKLTLVSIEASPQELFNLYTSEKIIDEEIRSVIWNHLTTKDVYAILETCEIKNEKIKLRLLNKVSINASTLIFREIRGHILNA
jgi:hypothetical protein